MELISADGVGNSEKSALFLGRPLIFLVDIVQSLDHHLLDICNRRECLTGATVFRRFISKSGDGGFLPPLNHINDTPLVCVHDGSHIVVASALGGLILSTKGTHAAGNGRHFDQSYFHPFVF